MLVNVASVDVNPLAQILRARSFPSHLRLASQGSWELPRSFKERRGRK